LRCAQKFCDDDPADFRLRHQVCKPFGTLVASL
jgi:hypothetical protein